MRRGFPWLEYRRMPDPLDRLIQLWHRLSLIGVRGVDYSTAHRITLSNQIAVVGTVVPNLYNLFYLLLDDRALLPVIPDQPR